MVLMSLARSSWNNVAVFDVVGGTVMWGTGLFSVCGGMVCVGFVVFEAGLAISVECVH